MHSGSPSDGKGPVSTQGSPWGSYSNSSNQKIFLAKVVGYEKKNPPPPNLKPRKYSRF